MPSTYFLNPAEEKAEYDLHENDPTDAGYRKFLNRLCLPLLGLLPEHSSGLDFGSGPGPTLSGMLAEAGHTVSIYDPFYAPNKEVLGEQYDFITATEVVEHLHFPAETFSQLLNCLKPGGTLALMTKLSTGPATFPAWHYKNDRTHVVFYSRETFAWIGKKWNAKVDIMGKDVIFLRKLP